MRFSTFVLWLMALAILTATILVVIQTAGFQHWLFNS